MLAIHLRGPARSIVGLLFLGLLATTPARAEDPPEKVVEDGLTQCRVMNAVADRDVGEWRAKQPKEPPQDPRSNLVLGAPWAPVIQGIGRVPPLLTLSTILPHPGVAFRLGTSLFSLSLPWSFPLGPAFTCSRRTGEFTVANHRPFRAIIEPGILFGDRAFVAWGRAGVRWIHHPAEWVIGLGGGAGATLEVLAPPRVGISPELVLRLGRCCEPGYFILAARVDVYPGRPSPIQPSVNLGLTYF